MLRILADENVPGPAVEALRAAGHDVVWIPEQTRGIKDPAILQQARDNGRLIVTFDKDFGELVYRRGASASAGVVLFRTDTRSPEAAAEQMVRVLAAHENQLQGHFTVVTRTKIRVTKMV